MQIEGPVKSFVQRASKSVRKSRTGNIKMRDYDEMLNAEKVTDFDIPRPGL